MGKKLKCISHIHVGNKDTGLMNYCVFDEIDPLMHNLRIQVFNEKFNEPNFHIFFVQERIEIEVSIKTLQIINYWYYKPLKRINYKSWNTYKVYKQTLKDWLLSDSISDFICIGILLNNYKGICGAFEMINEIEIPIYNNKKIVKLLEHASISTKKDYKILKDIKKINAYIADRPKMTPHIHVEVNTNQKNSTLFEVSLKDLTILNVKGLSLKESKKYKNWDRYLEQKQMLINWLKVPSTNNIYKSLTNLEASFRTWNFYNEDNKIIESESEISKLFNINVTKMIENEIN
jgi:hypothetical protein